MDKKGIFVVGYWVLVAAFTSWYLASYDEFEVLAIRAALDMPDLADQVYAQFVYTQRLQLPEPVEVSRLEVPMYISRERPVVRLLEAGVVVKEWGVETKEYALESPVELSGEVEVQLDGGHIGHDEVDWAPRVFIEKADYVYPDGNYRIAANEKQGDIAMTFYGRRHKWSSLGLSLAEKPGEVGGRLVTYGLWAVMLGVLPLVGSVKQAPAAGSR